MERSEDLTARCMELLTINRALFDAGYLEAAYHSLEAALYCAESQGDPHALRMVETIATEELHQLKRFAPSAAGAKSASVPMSMIESGRWANLKNLYGIAMRQANLKASSPDLRVARSHQFKPIDS